MPVIMISVDLTGKRWQVDMETPKFHYDRYISGAGYRVFMWI